MTPRDRCARTSRRSPELILSGWGVLFNGAWEAIQTPLYADAGLPWRSLVWSRAHCTGGDVLILLMAHAITALAFRDRHWAQHRRTGPVIVFIVTGITYTAWSEWFNTTVTLSWAYAESMPTIFGIGLAPLLQWLLVPAALVMLMRRSASAATMRDTADAARSQS